MKHFIVTGAYGLIGSNFCKFLEQDRNNVITKIKFNELDDIQAQADVICHMSGYGQPLKFTKDKIKTIEVNTTTTIELFKHLKPGGKFLYISSSEVYSGAISPNVESILGTTNPDHPRACYIEGKRCGEAICNSYRELGFDVKIARLALAYGPGTKIHDTRVINQFIEQGFTGNITLRDNGESIRTYLYVQDAVELMWKVLCQGKDVVYNIGGFSTLTILQLAQEIGQIMNAKITTPQSDTGLKDAPQDVHLNMDKTLREFNQYFTPLHKGLKKTIEYQKHLYGY